MPPNKPPFSGFAQGPFTMTSLPGPFFSELLPLVDDLAELKVLLFCFWALPQKDGPFPYLLRRDFAGNVSLMDGIAVTDPDADPEVLLDAALERAIARGAMLRAVVEPDEAEPVTLYFVNTRLGRAALEQINAGEWKPGDLDRPVEILPERPNIYLLYEANIGPLTPMIADDLKDAAAEFPRDWLEEAIRISATANKRSMRYIRAVLERWRTEGKSPIETGKDDDDGKRYVTGKYADFIEH